MLIFAIRSTLSQVNISSFQDGDKNTAIIDLDGTLGGYLSATIRIALYWALLFPRLAAPECQAGSCDSLSGKLHPISLNNLELNAAGGDPGGSVDECQAEGKQDTKLRKGDRPPTSRPAKLERWNSSAVSRHYSAGRRTHPAPMTKPRIIVGMIRWSPLPKTPPNSAERSSSIREMVLGGRDGQGIWEPKVQSGSGYTVTASAGIPNLVHVAASIRLNRIFPPTRRSTSE